MLETGGEILGLCDGFVLTAALSFSSHIGLYLLMFGFILRGGCYASQSTQMPRKDQPVPR